MADIFQKLKKGVKRSKAKAKAKRNKRQRKREQRRRNVKRKKQSVEEFGSDVAELAEATRAGGAVKGLFSGAKKTAESGRRAAKGLEKGANRADEGLDRLGLEAPEQDEPMFGAPEEPMFSGPDTDQDDEFRIL